MSMIEPAPVTPTVDSDDVTIAEIREAITFRCAAAKRLPRVVGTPRLPTPWDAAYAAINDWLDLLDELA